MVWVWSIPVHFIGPFGLYRDNRETSFDIISFRTAEIGGFIEEKAPCYKIKEKREEIKSEVKDKSKKYKSFLLLFATQE